jgi:hypothetical protein
VVICVLLLFVQRKAAEHLRTAMKLLAEDAEFSLDKGYAWSSLKPEAAAADGSAAPAESAEPVLAGPRARADAVEKRRRVHEALSELVQQEVRSLLLLTSVTTAYVKRIGATASMLRR